MRSAVDNLLTNAWTHGRAEDGVARIEVTLDSFGGPYEPAAVLTVDDHGPGVPPDRREDVFQRFHRGPDSPGSGLGLTLVAQQVALHRGRITVRDVERTLPLLHRDWPTSTAGTPPDPARTAPGRASPDG
ncbi:ATP-binding protein [Streptomyces yokosukanensis]|uniref:sensor histidine kinase n=1 Tax=Streptomyces yokosukanensis TaxID=67386 RepID=UPI00099F21BD